MASSASVQLTSSSSLKFEPPVGFGIDGQDIGHVDDAAALATCWVGASRCSGRFSASGWGSFRAEVTDKADRSGARRGR